MQTDVEALGRALQAFWAMRRDNRVIEGVPATVTELNLLRAIADEGTARVSSLAARTCVDTSVASRQVAHLESHGFVDRTTDPEDRRSHVLRLTARGTEVLEHWRAQAVRRWTAALEDWSSDDIRHLTQTLHRLRGDLVDSGLFRGPLTTHDPSSEEHATA